MTLHSRTTIHLLVALFLCLASATVAAQEPGYIGVELQDLTAEQARVHGLAGPRGARVVALKAGAPAERAGLKTGDVITTIDGRVVENRSDFISSIQRLAPDTPPATRSEWPPAYLVSE